MRTSISSYLHDIQLIEEANPKALLKAFDESIVTEDKYLKPLAYYKCTHALNNILILLDYLEELKKLTNDLSEKIDYSNIPDPYHLRDHRDWAEVKYRLGHFVNYDTSELQAGVRTMNEEINNTSFEAVKESALKFFSVLRRHVESQIDKEKLELQDEEKLELYNLCEQGLIEVRKVLPLVEKYYRFSDNNPFDGIINYDLFPEPSVRPFSSIYKHLIFTLEENRAMTWAEQCLWDLHGIYVKTIWLLGFEVKRYNEYDTVE